MYTGHSLLFNVRNINEVCVFSISLILNTPWYLSLVSLVGDLQTTVLGGDLDTEDVAVDLAQDIGEFIVDLLQVR